MTIVGPLGILLIILIRIFNFHFTLLPGFKNGSSAALKFTLILCLYSVLIGMFYSLFSKGKLLQVQVNERQIQSAKKLVPVVFVTLIVVLLVSLIIKGVEKGTL
jgi:hypothetical protein